jgi:DNA-binding NtrC family response regulator
MKLFMDNDCGVTPAWARMREPVAKHGPCRVVYVDDDPDYAYLFKVSLERLGHQVLAFTDPGQALAALEESDAVIDAFITDFNMPGQSGVDLAIKACRRRPGLPRAVITNQLEDAIAVAMEAQILAMPKPASPPEFDALLKRVLAAH